MAFAPPPGTIDRLRCFRISTGASRLTREISPKTNSSATRSPSTATLTRGKLSTIFSRRCAFEFLAGFVIGKRIVLFLAQSFTAFVNGIEDHVQCMLRIGQLQLEMRNT